MYLMKNNIHDADREKATSIVKNLTPPPLRVFKANPYLNRIEDEEILLNLHATDLLSMA
jgi:hypothetical protein